MKRTQLFIGTKNGLFRYDSDETRKEWSLSGPFLPGWTLSALHIDPQAHHRLVAATCHLAYGPSIRVSEDSGESWRELEGSPRFRGSDERTVQQIWRIAASASQAIYYAGVEDAGLFTGSDGGTWWQEVDSLSRHLDEAPGFVRRGVPVDSIVVDPQDDQRLWVATRRSGVFRTVDGGGTWRACDNGLPNIVMMTGDPQRPGVLYAQTTGGMFRSLDGADSWERADAGLPSRFGFALHVSAQGDVYTVPLESQTERHVKGGRLQVYRSTNTAERWEPLSGGLPTHPYYAGVLRDGLDTDDLDPNGIYFGTTAGEVFLSNDCGESWTQLPQTFARITVVRARAWSDAT